MKKSDQQNFQSISPVPPPCGAMPGGFMPDVPMCGGTTDHSYDAPKTIHSSVITEFSTHFFVYDEEDNSLSGHYHFSLKSGNGRTILKEDYKYMIQEEVSPDIFDKIQKMIERNKLVMLNGTNKVTHGLPAEYQPCYLKAIYDSGEILNFVMPNDPFAQWARETESILRETFARLGHKECLAPPSATNIKQFHIEFREGDLCYSYCIINSKETIERMVYNKAKEDMESEKIVEVSDRFYADLHKYIQSHQFNRFNNRQLSFDSEWKKGKLRYYEIYFEYENGKQLYGSSAEQADCDIFYQEIPGLKAFFDKYIEDSKEVERNELFSLDVL